VATYGCESQTLIQEDEQRIRAFEMKGLRRIMRVCLKFVADASVEIPKDGKSDDENDKKKSVAVTEWTKESCAQACVDKGAGNYERFEKDLCFCSQSGSTQTLTVNNEVSKDQNDDDSSKTSTDVNSKASCESSGGTWEVSQVSHLVDLSDVTKQSIREQCRGTNAQCGKGDVSKLLGKGSAGTELTAELVLAFESSALKRGIPDRNAWRKNYLGKQCFDVLQACVNKLNVKERVVENFGQCIGKKVALDSSG
jgi:hypothetical protein